MSPEGQENMRLDRMLLTAAEAGEARSRCYTWREICVTLGSSQDPHLALIDASTTCWAMRPTGGLAVLHGHDLTVALALPMEGCMKSYREATKPILSAFADQGIWCQLAEDRADPASRLVEDCFALRGRSDIIDSHGRKLCGCALRRTRNSVLLQASIPVRKPDIEPAEIIRGGVAATFTRLDESQFADSVARALEAVYLNIRR